MNKFSIKKAPPLKGEITVPGDKSISHRSIILGSLAAGDTAVSGLLRGEDNMATINAFRLMGIQIDDDGKNVLIHGKGLHGLKEPEDVIDCGNSGTSMRLISGLLASQGFFSVLTGDRYLRKRPMRRIITPLSMMGAEIYGRESGEKAPLAICGKKLKGIRYDSPISSAQVKSALMLAGLFADGETTITEPTRSRDHSERMMASFGANITVFDNGVTISPASEFTARDITVPGDISSAAFFLVAASIVKGSELMIRNVGINPTRTGILDILAEMGADITFDNVRDSSGEPVADLLVKSTDLKGISISGDVVPRAIDEFPVIAVAAAFAEGDTVIRDAGELRVKESDRISAIATNLRNAGADIEEHPDGMTIRGGKSLKGTVADSRGDHRIAMSMIVAGMASEGVMEVIDTDCIATSFPSFFNIIDKVAK